jgi:hypothetical protein
MEYKESLDEVYSIKNNEPMAALDKWIETRTYHHKDPWFWVHRSPEMKHLVYNAVQGIPHPRRNRAHVRRCRKAWMRLATFPNLLKEFRRRYPDIAPNNMTHEHLHEITQSIFTCSMERDPVGQGLLTPFLSEEAKSMRLYEIWKGCPVHTRNCQGTIVYYPTHVHLSGTVRFVGECLHQTECMRMLLGSRPRQSLDMPIVFWRDGSVIRSNLLNGPRTTCAFWSPQVLRSLSWLPRVLIDLILLYYLEDPNLLHT